PHRSRVPRLARRAPGGYREGVAALARAFDEAREHTERPSFISLRTIIAWPAPDAQNTGEAHGAALGAEEVAKTKRILGFDPEVNFPVEDEAGGPAGQGGGGGQAAQREGGETLGPRQQRNARRRPPRLDRLSARRLPEGWTSALPQFPPDAKGTATRRASGAVLNALAGVLPELWGGSADLAGSNNTTMKGEPSFIPPEHQTRLFP